MWGFLKKAEVNPPLYKTDIHSHILPGIDDGSPDIETSVRLVRGIYNLGINKTVATPHVIADMFRNTPETINNALQLLTAACKKENIPLTAQILVYPWIDGKLNNPSIERNGKGYLLEKETMFWFQKQYTPRKEDQCIPEISPCYETDFTGLAPAFMLTAEFDPLLDDGIKYFQQLKAAGKDVSAAEKHLADTKSNLDVAKSSLYTIDKAVATFIGSSNPKESWVNLKTTYTNINTNIRAAYEALKAALAAAEAANTMTAPVPTASSSVSTGTSTR